MNKLLFEILKKSILNLLKTAKDNNLVDTVIMFTLSKETAIERLSNRNEGRTDDNPEAIAHRFEVYKEKTKPVLEFLKENFVYYEIDAEPTVEEIYGETLKVLKLE